MLDITGDQVQKLNDTDLRELVARLCEAELRRCRLPVTALTAGGAQDAPDGGIDVRIDLDRDVPGLDFIRRAKTGFQVKRPDMPPAEIRREMRPKGSLRPAIKLLAESSGAYIIVSSQGSVADAALANRKSAMADAIDDPDDRSRIAVDFYDRDRLATWINQYPGVAAWFRERIGERLRGWQAYGSWAAGDRPDSEYLFDTTACIRWDDAPNHEAASAEQGIAAMRGVLSKPGGVIRLIGLAGVGKTRLVQALFDSRVGQDALDSSLVLYTDLGNEPEPAPGLMLERLSAVGRRAIVVVDNCNPDAHRRLTQLVQRCPSILSLITVEYDVALDEPEETKVFRLEPSSEGVLMQVLSRLTPDVSAVDRHRIAEFSGGNPRIALALARTVRRHESLGNLNDSDLFRRLFHQRHNADGNLVRAAEVCSLVYSFDGETLEGEAAELPLLAELAEVSVPELFRSVAELRARDLIQKRGRWRAVLPPAIAIRLAKQALENLSAVRAMDVLSRPGASRLMGSFGRRLGQLHDSEHAKAIARRWLTDPVWLAKPAQLNDWGVALFHCIAPVEPVLAIEAIEIAANEQPEKFLSPDSAYRSRWVHLLHSLAYEPELFDRACLLIARFYTAEVPDIRHDSARDSFTGLFHMYLSGTHAPAEQRLAFVRSLLSSDHSRQHELALDALNAMLEAWHFSSAHEFSFGAHPRDYGWQPKTYADVHAWYRSALALVADLGAPARPHRHRVRTMMADRFRGLWMRAGIPNELEELSSALAGDEGWSEGWIAVRQVLRFDSVGMPERLLARLKDMEDRLRPRDLTQKIRAYVLTSRHSHLDVADEDEEQADNPTFAYERANKIAEELGNEVARTDSAELAGILSPLLTGHSGRQLQFGRGLALGCPDVMAVWRRVCETLATVPIERRNVSLVLGFVEGVFSRDPATASNILDSTVTDPSLGPHFPFIQASVPLNEEAVERLSLAQEAHLASTSTYRALAWGRVSDGLTSEQFARLVSGISELPSGLPVAVELLSMRLHGFKESRSAPDSTILELGRSLLSRCDFSQYEDEFAHHLKLVARDCLAGADGLGAAGRMCASLASALAKHRLGAWRYGDLVTTIFRLQPALALNALVAERPGGHWRSLRREFHMHDVNPVESVQCDDLIEWANGDPSERYPRLANEITAFARDAESKELDFSPMARRIMNLAPDRATVLAALQEQLWPDSWSGSYALALEPYRDMLSRLTQDKDRVIAEWARALEIELSRAIEKDRSNDREEEQSFE